MDDLDPIDLSRALSDIPLFREFQRLVGSSRGGVNWEIASQIARAVASAGTMTQPVSPDDVEAFEGSCRVAEMRLGEVSELVAPMPIRVRVRSREEWAKETLDGSAAIVTRIAERLGLQISPAGMPGLPMKGLFDAIGPLFMGIQLGSLIGHLSRQNLAHYDLCFPLSGDGELNFNLPNIRQGESSLGIDAASFRMWLSLHEVAHSLQSTAIAWVRPHLKSLMDSYIDGAQVDPSELMARLEGLTDQEELNRLMSRPEELLPMLMGAEQRSSVERIRVMLAVLEGHADLLATRAGAPLLPEMDKIKEGLTRRRAERSSAERLLERLLGIDLPSEVYRQGVRFVAHVADSGHLHTLMSGPANLPEPDEIGEPSRWLTRVAFG